MNTAQKILLYVLYGLILLMVVFSLLALGDKNKAGYDKCHQAKCEAKGDAYCNKPREINNCCLGAGGQVAQIDGKLGCVFV